MKRAAGGAAEAAFVSAFQRLRPAQPPPAVEIRFRPYTAVRSSVRMKEGRALVRLSDLLEGAPRTVLDAVALLLISKLLRVAAPAGSAASFRRFLQRGDVRRQARLVRRVRGRKHHAPPEGRVHNLEEVFDRLNRRYFGGSLPRPALGWSRQDSHRLLGHFDPDHHTIIVSRVFDSRDIPACALEYVLYHEMLHVKHPVEYRRGRRRVHSPDFRRDERLYSQYEKARRILAGLCPGLCPDATIS